MLSKIVLVPKVKGNDSSSLIFVVLDDTGSSFSAFAISDASKEPNEALKVST